jgi:NAD(P)H dehydrogenase (quinone)
MCAEDCLADHQRRLAGGRWYHRRLTYFGQMASRVNQMFDVTEKIYGELEGKVGAAFTTSGGAGCGHELTNMSIITAMLVAGMVVPGTTHGPHFGPFAVGMPDEKALRQAREMGVRVATLTKRLAISN